MMIGTWMASQGVPERTGAMGWMKPSMGRRSVSAMVRAAPALAFTTRSRLRMKRRAMIAKRPTPQARKRSDSNMLEAGMPPATAQRVPIPQLITAKPATSRTAAARSRARRRVRQPARAQASAAARTTQATRVGRAAVVVGDLAVEGAGGGPAVEPRPARDGEEAGQARRGRELPLRHRLAR